MNGASSLPLEFGVGPPLPPGMGGDVEPPPSCKLGGPAVGIFILHSSSLPPDTRGGVGPPTPIGVGGPLGSVIMCHPPPRRGMTEAWWLMWWVVGL